MENKIGILFISIFAVIIMFIVPSYQLAQKQDDLAQQVVDTETAKFVDSVRSKGYLTQQMINEFMAKINIGSYVYRMDMKHEKNFYNPIFEDVNDPLSFTGEYDVLYEEFHTHQINEFFTSNPKGKYKMRAEDFFSVHIENVGQTSSNIILNALQGTIYDDTPSIIVHKGGKVLNENY